MITCPNPASSPPSCLSALVCIFSVMAIMDEGHRFNGVRRLKKRFFIRIADGLIIRMDRLSFMNEEYVLVSSVQMNPVVNVEDFERYLKY